MAKLISFGVAGFLMTMLVGTASASTVTIGTNSGSNTIPFGSTLASQYQQVYSSNAFSGVFNITEINFYVDPAHSAALDGGTYTLSLSETSIGVGALSSNLANNIGANNTVVYSGANSLDFILSSPYLYDPSIGNLLLNVSIANGTSNGGYSEEAGIDPLTSRAYSGPFLTGGDQFGLVTTFTSNVLAPVPEPSTWAMMLLGFIGVGFMAYRRKAKPALMVNYRI
jgi:hypothetical protein